MTTAAHFHDLPDLSRFLVIAMTADPDRVWTTTDLQQTAARDHANVTRDTIAAHLRRLACTPGTDVRGGFVARAPKSPVGEHQWTATHYAVEALTPLYGTREPSGMVVTQLADRYSDNPTEIRHAVPAGVDRVSALRTEWMPILCGRATGDGINYPGPLSGDTPTCAACLAFGAFAP